MKRNALMYHTFLLTKKCGLSAGVAHSCTETTKRQKTTLAKIVNGSCTCFSKALPKKNVSWIAMDLLFIQSPRKAFFKVVYSRVQWCAGPKHPAQLRDCILYDKQKSSQPIAVWTKSQQHGVWIDCFRELEAFSVRWKWFDSCDWAESWESWTDISNTALPCWFCSCVFTCWLHTG